MLALLVLARAAWATCATSATNDDLRAALAQVEDAYARMDPGFGSVVELVERTLPCLGEPIQPSVAAAWHRAEGMRAFLAKDDERAAAAFAAARALETYTFPERVVPPGNALLRDYEAVPVSAIRRTPVAPRAEGALAFDGHKTNSRPDVPTVLQLLDETGKVELTQALGPEDPLPYYVSVAEPVAAVVPPPAAPSVVAPPRPPVRFAANDPHRPRRVAGTAFCLAGAGLVAGGAVLWKYGYDVQHLYGLSSADYYEQVGGIGLMAGGGVALAAGGLMVVLLDGGPGVAVAGAW